MDPVLVALATQDGSGAALRWAEEVAALLGAPLAVAGVFVRVPAGRHPGDQPDSDGLRTRRTAIEQMLAGGSAPTVEIDVRAGDPLATLLAVASERHPSMIVIGSDDARDGDTPGGLALDLLQRSRCAVAVVPDGHEPLRGGKFVVGIDGTKANGPALRRAEQIARAAQGTITAVFAYDPLDDTFVLPQGWHRHSDEVRAEVRRVRSVPVDLVMEPGTPASVLTEIASRERAAAVVVGTRGHRGFGGHATGRVPALVLHKASCPTIAVPH